MIEEFQSVCTKITIRKLLFYVFLMILLLILITTRNIISFTGPINENCCHILATYLGFGDSSLNMIKSYLYINGILSEATKLIDGVPQGRVLAPLYMHAVNMYNYAIT